MSNARGLGRTAPRTPEEEEFDRDAEEQSEVECINVSPFVARFEVATFPGSKPRRYRLEPGRTVMLQHGYTVEGKGAGREPVRPTIESLTERQAWPGEYRYTAEGKQEIITNPGPSLPMVVAQGDRADEIRAKWADAMERRATAATAPLKMTLTRTDGSKVDVEADISEPVPTRKRAATAPPREDDEDQSAAPLDEPPPEHDEPLDAVTVPAAASTPKVEPVVPVRGGRGGRSGG